MNYSTEEKICILLGQIGVSASKFFSLWQQFDGAEDFLQNVEKNEAARSILGAKFMTVCNGLKNGAADRIVEKMESCDIFATTCFSESFPDTLANIPDSPYILFYRGDVGLLKTQCISVVGTRKVSTYGRKVAAAFTEKLAKHFTVVSGLAYGVDSVAHETTLQQGGKTIAVLGGGLIDVYPAANSGLADQIVSCGGLILTEYGYNAAPRAFHFPHRNRIVAGLSSGLLVCQAPLKSGTASTVECALDQGRDVFVVPGEIFDDGFKGSNQLIKSMQGVCVTSPQDILDFYRVESDEIQTAKTVQLSFEEQSIVEALAEGPLTFDKLIEKTKISPADLNFLLANLEIKSIISRLPANCYRLYGGLE